MISRTDRIAGGLIGLLVGDALGVPYEFHPPENLPSKEHLEYTPPPGFRRAHSRVEPGTWSDDGAQALALLDSLLDCGRLDVEDFGRKIVAWLDEGRFAVGNDVFDCGITTQKAILNLRDGVPATRSGPADVGSNGNGSLMRVLPLVLWHSGTDRELAHDATRQSIVTHGHPRSQGCCALYCLWGRRVLDQAAEPWAEAVASFRQIYRENDPIRAEVEAHVRPDDAPSGTGSGYVVDCLNTARLALQCGGYEDVVRSAVAFGNDTDTTACVAGGIAGIRDGVDAIPDRWRSALRGAEIVSPLLQRLLNPSG